MKNWIKRDGDKAVLTIFDGDVEREARVPYRFDICTHCEGSGQSSSYLGAFTGSEWSELDDDFKDAYMSGQLDRPCDHCREYPGRVLVPNIKALSAKDQRLWCEQCRDEREYQALCAAERRMGA